MKKTLLIISSQAFGLVSLRSHRSCIAVTNLWPNGLIGDEAEPDDLVWGKERYFTHVTPRRKICRNLQVIPDWVKQNKERPGKNRITFTTTYFFDRDGPAVAFGFTRPGKTYCGRVMECITIFIDVIE